MAEQTDRNNLDLSGEVRATNLDAVAQSIWEEIAKISAEVPAEEWERVPRDLAKNLDHYLYGCEKEDVA